MNWWPDVDETQLIIIELSLHDIVFKLHDIDQPGAERTTIFAFCLVLLFLLWSACSVKHHVLHILMKIWHWPVYNTTVLILGESVKKKKIYFWILEINKECCQKHLKSGNFIIIIIIILAVYLNWWVGFKAESMWWNFA